MVGFTLGVLRRACRCSEPRRSRRQVEDEVAAVRGENAALRTALAAERVEAKVSGVLLCAYELADDQLRRAVHEIALPTLEGCDAKHGGVTHQIRALEDAIPGHIDGRLLREGVLESEEWS